MLDKLIETKGKRLQRKKLEIFFFSTNIVVYFIKSISRYRINKTNNTDPPAKATSFFSKRRGNKGEQGARTEKKRSIESHVAGANGVSNGVDQSLPALQTRTHLFNMFSPPFSSSLSLPPFSIFRSLLSRIDETRIISVPSYHQRDHYHRSNDSLRVRLSLSHF